MAEEIIIDGIDINKCQHYTGNVEYLSREWTCRAETIGTKCEENPNCYYKQLKRKEQECEKYKQVLNEIKEIINEPCIICNKTCEECNNNCEHKDILNIINKARESK